jgi:dethiobiotin synthetase
LCYIDLFQLWELPVYVVTKHYLGSINHTLLTLNALMSREIEIAGLIVNGERNEASERIYHAHFPDLMITTVPELNEFSKESIQQAARLWIEQQA